MTDHNIVTREEWIGARKELLEKEKELVQRKGELAQQRQNLPWVKIEKEYTFDTADGKKTLADLFDGRSQLIVYHIMFGPDYSSGACPGCSNMADHFDAGVVHLNHRDVTLLAISRAPFEMIQAYKQRMGWTFPWVSSFGSDYSFDLGFALTAGQISEIDEIQALIEKPPEWLKEWSEQVGAPLEKGFAENPGWAAFARKGDVVYQTYSCFPEGGGDLMAPYFHQLLDLTPTGRGEEEKRTVRHDEYEHSN